MEDIICVSDLSFSYNNKDNALKDISFKIKKNSYNVIVGANGSGKSTLVKLLCGIEKNQKGKIVIDGIELGEENLNKIRGKTGIIFQNPDNQFVATSVRDDIIFGLENYNIDPTKMDEIVSRVANITNITHLLEREPSSLSGGEKQKAAISSIIALTPKIIILDEASSMLDPLSKIEFKQLIQDLKNKEDITIISITHDREETLDADNIILLNEGKLIYSGDKLGYFNLNEEEVLLPNLIKLQKKLNMKDFVLKEEILINKLKDKVYEN